MCTVAYACFDSNNTPPPHGVGDCDRYSAIVRGGDGNIVVYVSPTEKITRVNIVHGDVSQ